MSHTTIPQGYQPLLGLYDTQKAIGLTKRLFEDALSGALNLRRVSAPLFVEAASGLNDNLNGVERPVSFTMKEGGGEIQVVHSLAKWKRLALRDYGFSAGEGLVADMKPSGGMRTWTTCTPSMWTSGTGRRSSPRSSAAPTF